MRLPCCLLLSCLLLSAALVPAQTTPPPADLLVRLANGDRDAAVTLRRLGVEALPILRRAMTDPKWWPPANEKAVQWIAWLLDDLGPAAEPAFADVVSAFVSAETVRRHSSNTDLLRCLRNACPLPPGIGEWLAADLRARTPARPSNCVQTILCLECAPATNLEPLFQSLQDADPCRRIVAAQQLARDSERWSPAQRDRALAALRAAATAELPRRVTLLNQAGGRVRGMVTEVAKTEYELEFAEVLVRLGCTDATSLPALRRRLQHFDPQVRVQTVQTIGQMGAEATGALSDLIALARWMTPEGCEALTALGMIGNKEPRVLDVLRKACKRPEPQMAVRARAALRRLGEQER